VARGSLCVTPRRKRLIRFTTAYDGPARVNCIVPGWIATPRGLREASRMSDVQRAAAGPMVAMEAITAAVSDLLADDTARGQVVVLR
jgi:NAD(P)-dependent dehydrogenase (short-subunit alcohol dehydrogenase family)